MMTCHSEPTTQDQLATYAAIVWEPDEIIEVRPLPPVAAWAGFPRWMKAGELAQNNDVLKEHNQGGTNIYAGVLPRTHDGGSKAVDTDSGRVVWADFDNTTPADAVMTAKQGGLPDPTMVVASGHGAHLFWRLAEPEHKDTLCPLVKRLALHLGTDKSVSDPARILRLPGFTNHKKPPANAYIADAYPERVYTFSEIAACIPEPEQAKPAPAQAQPTPQPDRAQLIQRARAYVSKMEGSNEGGRTTKAFHVACVLLNDLGLTESEARPVLVGWDNMSNNPPLVTTYGEAEYDKLLTNAMKYHKGEANRLNKETPAPPWVEAGPKVVVDDEGEDERDEYIKNYKDMAGPMPDDLYDVPGFVGEVMQYTMENAPRPHKATAFAGALCLLSLLTGRKVRDPRDLRTNLYMTILGGSGIGKQFPRAVNVRILERVGLADHIGTAFASGQGIVNTLHTHHKMLYQVDEMDKLLSSLTVKPDKHTREIEKQLMQLFSSANVTYHGDSKADQTQNISIHQPHLSLFGTSTPEVFYRALSEDTLTNGFIARMLVIESQEMADRPPLHTSKVIPPIPDHIIDTARYWATMTSGDGNLSDENPTPKVVEWDDDALAMLDAYGQRIFDEAKQSDGAQRAILNRAEEHCCKLALLYACSRSAGNPVMDKWAASWAIRFMDWFVPHIRYAAYNYVADNVFHADILKVMRAIKDKANKYGWTRQRDIQKQTHLRKRELEECLEYIMDTEDVEKEQVQSTGGRIAWRYRIISI